MTDAQLVKIENELKLRLPPEYREILAARSDELRALTIHYPRGAEPYFSERLILDADRLVEMNQIERRSDSGTGAAIPNWHKRFILIGSDGGGGYYCLPLDRRPGVYMIGSDCGDQPEAKAATLAAFLDESLVDYPAMSRRYPAPGKSSFDPSCDPHDRVGIFLDSQEFEGNGRIAFQGDDRNLTFEDLAAAGVDRSGIHICAAKVLAALLQTTAEEIAVKSYLDEADPALRLNITGLPTELNDRPYWYAAVQVFGHQAEIVFYGFVGEVPSKLFFEWRMVTTPLSGLIKAAYPGPIKITGSQAKPPSKRGDKLIYAVSFNLET